MGILVSKVSGMGREAGGWEVKVIWTILALILSLGPIFIFYNYAMAYCVPHDHTDGFCVKWSLFGAIFFPLMTYYIIGLVGFVVLAVLNKINDRKTQ